MMRKSLLLVGLLFSLSSSADLIDNGAFATDTASGLDWLDPSTTYNESYADVEARIAPGGDLFGWRRPTRNEVDGLFTAIGLPLVNDQYQDGLDPEFADIAAKINAANGLLGPVIFLGNSFVGVSGIIGPKLGDGGYTRLGARFNNTADGSPGSIATVELGAGISEKRVAFTSHYLVRNTVLPDTDADGVVDVVDNCPSIANANQVNSDGADDGGDACDNDDDNDGWADVDDNCPTVANPQQEDGNADGIGDVCDADNDGVRDDLDNCPLIPNADQSASSAEPGRGVACEGLPPGC